MRGKQGKRVEVEVWGDRHLREVFGAEHLAVCVCVCILMEHGEQEFEPCLMKVKRERDNFVVMLIHIIKELASEHSVFIHSSG